MVREIEQETAERHQRNGTRILGRKAAQAGVAGTMGAGATVLGYYLVYWLGVRRRLKRWQSSGRVR